MASAFTYTIKKTLLHVTDKSNTNTVMSTASRPPPSDVAVVMVPLPAQGHLNQLLHLSRLLSSRGIPVHYAASAPHLRQARFRSSATSAAVDFHELPTPPFENPPPNPHAPTKFPLQIMPALTASLQMRGPLTKLVEALARASRRVVVIHDSLMSYVVQDAHAIPRVECYTFRSISAFSVASWDVEISPLLHAEKSVAKEIPPLDGYYPPEFAEFMNLQRTAKRDLISGEIYNSCRAIEGFCLDLLERRMVASGKGLWALGPFNPVSNSDNGPHECLGWLDQQAPNESVVLVSFGTTCSFSDEQIREIGLGLERSEHKFLWVLRDADRGDIFHGGARELDELLGEGFEARVSGRGIVVRDWAPQLEILGHRSTGGFVSHCGWNSCLESISMGVPIATWPQHSDQPANAALVTDILRVGVEMKRWSLEDELVSSGVVETAVRRLMGRSGEGNEMRKRAAELGEAVRKSVIGEGGESRKEMDSFISHVTR